jgi:hypothetical protein
VKPLLGRLERGGAGLRLGHSAAHYDEVAALLEGFSRPLWGLAAYAAGRKAEGKEPEGACAAAIGMALKGLAEGSDPRGPNYWGVGADRDQRYVEMAAIALALLIAPEAFWEPLPEEGKANLAAWLGTINGVELPPTNWELFRILVNLALRGRGAAYDRARLDASLAAIDALYREDGWYVDETNYDLYNPMGFHFFGLLYARLAGDKDPERAARYRERARLFAAQYLPWFARDGSAVPFGRSLTYRFAAVAFFSACAFAGEEVLPWGALKGLVLRNLRDWLSRPILDGEGLLTIGYGYPNLVMAEQYNSPASPYWALKAYLVLALPEEHPFWAAEELPLPPQPAVSHNAPPRLLACRTGSGAAEHVYLLNAGQYPCWESVHAAAKYAKYAYSNRFGFCVQHSSYDLPKVGCDSSLVLSEGDGYWRERRRSRDRRSCPSWVVSTWEPWPDVVVRSWVLPLGPWQVRVHEIDSSRELECAEGGYSLPDAGGPELPNPPRISRPRPGALLASFPWAFGGIVDLSGDRAAELHKPEPNLNVLHPRVLVPLLRGRIPRGRSVLACAVLAGLPGDGLEGEWGTPPSLGRDEASGRARITWSGRAVLLADDADADAEGAAAAVTGGAADKDAGERSERLRRKAAADMAAILRGRGFVAEAFDERGPALERLFGLIPRGSKVGLGGSMTLAELGVVERLRSGPYRLIDRYAAPDWDATMAAYREALLSDVFVTGVNAVTRKGELVCVDSSGNRVAAMIFGPAKVVVVAGVNKIVEDTGEAFARLKRIAPLNCRRLGHATPCAESGLCSDCLIPERMCNYTGIIHHGLKQKDRIHVLLIAEDLGF